MPAPASTSKTVQFGLFELDLQRGELRKQGVRVKLQEQPLKVLQLLVENPGQIISREQLRAYIWPANTFVEFDHGLYSAMARLRDALGDSADNPRFIETVARRGYRFIAPVVAPGKNISIAPRPLRVPGVNALRRWIVSVIAGLVGGAGLLAIVLAFDVAGAREWLHSRTTPIRSIAVLPLQNLSGDSEQEYFADGITDELTTELAQVGSLRVISRTSAMQYKGTKKTLPEIGRELRVDAIVEGSVTRSGDRVRITAQLVDAANDRHLWAASYDRDLRDILSAQAEAARSIADNIRVHLTPRETKRLARARPVDPEAYDLYLRGRHYAESITHPDIQKCIESLQKSIQKDPNFADGYTALADCYDEAGSFAVLSESEALSLKRHTVQKALELDENHAEAHAQLADLDMQDWNWSSAAVEFRRALELGPNLAATHEHYSDYLGSTGETEAAVREMRTAAGLDPLSTRYRAEVGWAIVYARHYDEAIQQFRWILELDPNYIVAHTGLERAYLLQGRYEPAIEETRWTFIARGFDASEADARIVELRAAFRSSGARGYWQKLLDWDRQDIWDKPKGGKRPGADSYYIAQDYAFLGDNEQAFLWLQKAYQHHESRMTMLKIDPRFDPIRSDPRFGELIRQVGLQ